jgi:uncharacterized membrane protein YdjX (TVP38/TMEM64 family)
MVLHCPSVMTSRRKITLVLIAISLAGLLIAASYSNWKPLWHRVIACYGLVSDRAQVEAFMKGWGPIGAPLAFIAVQVFQVVLAPIPGEASGFAGGYLFGVLPGLIYSTIGLTLGSVINFMLGRLLGRRYVATWMSAESFERFDALVKREGAILFFIFFLFPGFPKDYLCIFLGLTGISLQVFICMVGIGRIPGTLMLSLQGARIFHQDYTTFVVLILITLALAIPAYYWRDRIYAWIDRSDRTSSKRK